MNTTQYNIDKQEYNDIPVVYCKQCLSISIRVSDGIDYCDECGGTDMSETHIHEWEKMYEQKYNKKFLMEE